MYTVDEVEKLAFNILKPHEPYPLSPGVPSMTKFIDTQCWCKDGEGHIGVRSS